MITAFDDLHRFIADPWCSVIIILASFLCGAIIGFEREKGHKPAGLRTLILISVGSTIFTAISASPALGGHEPARIAAQIVTGVGFLGAGSILRDRHQITGLTTAATIWVAAAIGIVVGAGYVFAGLLLAIAVLLTLVGVRRLEPRLAGKCQFKVVAIDYLPRGGITRVLINAAIDELNRNIRVLEDLPLSEEKHRLRLEFCDHHRDHRAILASIAAVAGVEKMEI